MRMALLVVVLLFSPIRAWGADSFFSGHDLYRYLTTGDGTAGVMYIAGVVDATATYERWKAVSRLYCLPKGLNGDTLRDLMKKDLEENALARSQPAGSLVVNMLVSSFPCGKP